MKWSGEMTRTLSAKALGGETTPVFEVDGLRLAAHRDGAWLNIVEDVSFTVAPAQCVGIVGESGCGKSLTLRAALDVLPAGVVRAGGEIRYSPVPGEPAQPADPASLAGQGLGMVFQDSHASLDPTMRVGSFIAEVVRHRRGCSRKAAARRAVDLLTAVGVPDAGLRARAFPHELSGGLRQRATIALALATEPRVLLCDEPTTGLDVTVQAQVLALFNAARADDGLGVVFVSHDVAVIRQIADVVAVMYAGRIVEFGPADEVLGAPRHPYTRALIEAMPAVDRAAGAFTSISGSPPDPADYDRACRFRQRCPHAGQACLDNVPGVDARRSAHRSACVREDELLTAATP